MSQQWVGIGGGLPTGWTETMAGSMVVGAAMGGISGAVSGFMGDLIMGKGFSDGALKGAIGGFIGGAIGGAIGYEMKPKAVASAPTAEEGTTKNWKEQLAEWNEEAGIFQGDGPGQSFGGPGKIKTRGNNLQKGPVPNGKKPIPKTSAPKKTIPAPIFSAAMSASAGAALANLPRFVAAAELLAAQVGLTLPQLTTLAISPLIFSLTLLSGDTRINYSPPLKDLPGFPGARRVPGKGRARWTTPDGKILEWDSQHGDLEVYNKNRDHLGSADPNTGLMTKPPKHPRLKK